MGLSALLALAQTVGVEEKTAPRSRGRIRAVVVSILFVHTGLLAYGAWVHSPTLNEPGHLVAGISNWQFGRFELFHVNPPLVRMVAAVPVLLAGCQTDWSKFHSSPGGRAEGPIGADFIAANGERSMWLFTLARWACIPFSLIGGVFCFLWARDLFRHQGAGIVALVLWCFDPNIIAHGQLITADCAATSLGLGCGYFFWCWLKTPTWQQTSAAGFMLGLAELTKTTWVTLFVLWPVCWIFWRATTRLEDRDPHRWLREGVKLSAMLLLGLYLVNLGYGFDGTFTKLKEFTFVSTPFVGRENPGTPGNRFADSWLGGVPIPVPREYLLGIDAQKRDFESSHSESYLRGKWKDGGWWYYYIYALWVKMPHGTQCLLFVTVAGLIWRFPNCKLRDTVTLLAPAVVVLVLVSSQTGMNQHMRYVLPMFGFLFVLIGRGFLFLTSSGGLGKLVVVICLGWSVASSLWEYPHSLSYFNEFAGGPSNGPNHLLHSNVDWGQDLLFLKKWLDEHPEARPFHLAYYGYFNPSSIGLDYPTPPVFGFDAIDRTESQLRTKWYGLSVNYVYGDSFRSKKGAWAYFRNYEPTDRVGGSILIFRVSRSD